MHYACKLLHDFPQKKSECFISRWLRADLSYQPPCFQSLSAPAFPRPLLSHRKKLLNVFTYREEGDEGQNLFSSVRFAEITSSMILLAAEKMWLLKMDLWKKRVIWNSPALPNVSTQQRCIHMEALGLSVQDNECKVIILDVEGSLSSQHANCWALRMIWSLREFLHQTLDH